MVHKSYILIPYFKTCQFYYEPVLYFRYSGLAQVFNNIPPSSGVETSWFSSFLDYFIHWLVCRGLHVMNKIFRDADKAKRPVYQVHRCNAGVIPHVMFEKILFSNQEWCAAL